MNKKNIIVVLFLLVFLLAACGGEADNTANTAETEAGFGMGDGVNLNSLLFGSLTLKDAGHPISAEQAETLIPLWKLAKSLSTSDTAAQEEIQVAVDSIEAIMTAEQLDAITNNQLTPEEMTAIYAELGISLMPAGGDSADGGSPMGGMGGGVPGSGMGRGGGENPGDLTPDQIATLQAEREANGGGRGMRGVGSSPELFDALIEMLVEIAEN
ncbi:MAG: hypothetical protein ABFS17_02565 [Chloroflexota bacterium]